MHKSSPKTVRYQQFDSTCHTPSTFYFIISHKSQFLHRLHARSVSRAVGAHIIHVHNSVGMSSIPSPPPPTKTSQICGELWKLSASLHSGCVGQLHEDSADLGNTPPENTTVETQISRISKYLPLQISNTSHWERRILWSHSSLMRLHPASSWIKWSDKRITVFPENPCSPLISEFEKKAFLHSKKLFSLSTTLNSRPPARFLAASQRTNVQMKSMQHGNGKMRNSTQHIRKQINTKMNAACAPFIRLFKVFYNRSSPWKTSSQSDFGLRKHKTHKQRGMMEDVAVMILWWFRE